MDYLELWNRWVALTTLSEKDRSTMIGKLSGGVTEAVQTLTVLTVAEMKNQLEKSHYKELDKYLETAAPIVNLAVLDGYLLSLIVQGKNPMKTDIEKNMPQDNISDRWSVEYEKDECKEYLDQIDPIVSLFLQKIQELRVNQILVIYPEIVQQPYETTERLNQYIGWAIRQGYVLGLV